MFKTLLKVALSTSYSLSKVSAYLRDYRRLYIRRNINSHKRFIGENLAVMSINNRLEMILNLVLVKNVIYHSGFILGIRIEPAAAGTLEAHLLGILLRQSYPDKSFKLITVRGAPSDNP